MKPIRNLKYLAWIRTLPCLVCGRTASIEAAHTGPHGLAQKSPDTSAVPLCPRHHRTGRDSYHKLGARAFERHHRVSLSAVVARLNAKPSIRIHLGSLVARYGEEDYVLGPVEMGLELAVRKALGLKREDRVWRSWGETVETGIQQFLRIRERLRETGVESCGLTNDDS
jgi:hypothetical protein